VGINPKVFVNGLAPVQIFHAIPSSSIQRINEGQWVKKPFEGRAGMVPLQNGEGSEA